MLRRRKPLKRSSVPLRRTPLKRSTKPLRKVSLRHSKALREYFTVRAAYLAKNAACEAGPVILKAKLPECYQVPRCGVWAVEIHHLAGRGPNLCNTETFCAICRPCHEFIHAHAQKARDLSLLV